MPLPRLALVATALTFSFPSGAADPVLMPHRAAYVLTLGTAKSSGIAAVQGAMTIEYQQTCEGWTLTQRMRFRISDADGEQNETDVNFSSWEAMDGQSYRFTMRSKNNGAEGESLRGRAALDGRDKGGRAVFAEPENEVIELPPGTLFPIDHTFRLLVEALKGERGFTRFVFDGASRDGAMEVNALMAPLADTAPSESGPAIQRDLIAGLSWRVQMAFFKADANGSGEPEYETTMRLYSNGVGTDFVFDYSDFSIRGRLQRLERLPKPRC
jgi:hypothetical protein